MLLKSKLSIILQVNNAYDFDGIIIADIHFVWIF